MSDLDVSYIEKEVQNAYKQVGDPNIGYCTLVTEASNQYKESRFKDYSEPINLTGVVNLNPEVETISASGASQKVNATFTFASLELKNSSLLPLGLRELLKGKIIYAGEDYAIANILPMNNLLGTFILYSFECVGGTRK